MNGFTLRRGRAVMMVAVLAAGWTLWSSGCSKKVAPAPIPGTFSSGTFTDGRDGKTYKTVTIGGKTWLAENLNYEAGDSRCYDDDDSNCGKYGRLYDWETAVAACPFGWRLPSKWDWNILEQATGGEKAVDEKSGNTYWRGAGKKLKAKSGWGDTGGGTDDFGFSGLPGGIRGYQDGGSFGGAGDVGGWWTTSVSEYRNRIAYLCGLSSDEDDLIEEDANKRFGASVRCVQTEGAYTVTVLSNVTDAKTGGAYAAGDTVAVSAGTAPGRRFDRWTADAGNAAFADANSVATTFIMPANDVTVTANFAPIDTVAPVDPTDVEPGTVTDFRDSQRYKTAAIGGQTWMADNLRYDADDSWCYGDDGSNCEKYGRLYNWMAAQMACLPGWRLPSREDWDSLARAAGGQREPDDDGTINWRGAGKRLKAKTGWNDNKGKSGDGTDDYGYSAMPGGFRHYDGYFSNIGDRGIWWSAAESHMHNAYSRSVHRDDFLYENHFFSEHGASVRCVLEKDGAIKPDPERIREIEEEQAAAERGRLAKRKSAEERQKKDNERIEKLSTYFTDSRDGRKYRAVKMGRLTWMAENLNYEPKSGNSWCLANMAFYCGKHGRLYDWETAKTVCPDGWRLPSREDWDSLARAIGGKKWLRDDKSVSWSGASANLKSESGWDPRFSVRWKDEYGFSAQPYGRRKLSGAFEREAVDGRAEWWTTSVSGNDAIVRTVGYYGDNIDEYKVNKGEGVSVRCVQNK